MPSTVTIPLLTSAWDGFSAVDDTAVWVANPSRGKLIRFDPRTGTPQEIPVGEPVDRADVAAGDGAVFYVDLDSGTATRFDPATRKRVASGVRVATNPGAAVVAGSALWVTDTGRDTVARLTF